MLDGQLATVSTVDLDNELEARRAARLIALGASGSAAELRAMDALRERGVEARAVRVGERAPRFRLPTIGGPDIDLETLLAPGHAVLLFVCGRECGFCTATVHAYAERHDRFRARRTALAAIAPWSPQVAADCARPGMLAAVDSGLHVARAYGLVVDGQGIDWPGPIGHEQAHAVGFSHRRPLAATIVVDADATVSHACIDVDYRRRENPDVVLALLDRGVRGGDR